MTDAVRYRRFILELVRPHCGRSVLEVGAGLGDLAADLRGYERLVLTDVDPYCIERLERRFGPSEGVEVRPFDVERDEPLHPPVDTAIAINVLEHLRDDERAVRTLGASVVPEGRVVLFVPGYPALYGPYDRSVGHVRRYTPGSLRRVVERAGLEILGIRPVNLLGAVAWWIAVRVGGCAAPRPALVRTYDRLLVPFVARMERRWTPPFGQSVFCVARPSRA